MTPDDKLEASIRALQAQRATLGDVVDTAIAALREQHGASPASADPFGERKLVTIMFADISGFTQMSETRDPEEVRDLITAAFDVLVPVIERYGGIVDKFIGDAVMALFGAKVAREDDVRRALLAALDMRTAFDAFVAGSGLELGIHFGINTGTVVTGHVGASGAGAFSVMGDAVNLAARLEDLSDPGEILVGPNTRDLSGGGFAFDERPAVLLKGKKDPVPVSALLGRQEASTSRRLQAPLIGRERESAAVAAMLDRAVTGEACAIGIMGEAGTGKSRLVAEARLRSPPNVRWLQVRSVSHDQSHGFGALRSLVRAVPGLTPDAPVELQAQAIRARIAPRFDDTACDDAFAQLALLAGIEDGETPRMPGGAEDLLEQRVADTLSRWLEPLDGESPLAIVWEDLHWADRSSLRVLGLMARDRLPRGCLQILCFRPLKELQVAFAGNESALIELEQLSPAESTALIASLVEAASLGDEVIATILERADGNPFFLEEIIQSLIDSGALALSGGQVVPTANLDVGSIPATLQGVLMARLDQLLPREKHVLQTASVLGRIFEPPLLDALLVEDKRLGAGLLAILESLQTLDLVRRNESAGVSDGRYKFKHALTQEVAYQSVLVATRRKLHRAAANILASPTEVRADVLPLIAYHFENSDQPSLAVPWLTKAAEASARAHAPREAVGYYRRIVAKSSLLAKQPGRGAAVLANAYEAMGDLLLVGGRQAKALECLAHALKLVPESDALHRAAILRRSGLAWMSRRDAAQAVEFYVRAEELLDLVADRTQDWWSEWIELRLDLAWARSWLGENREALQLLHSGAEDIERHGNLGQRARYRDKMIAAQLFREAAHPSEATIAAAREALAMAREWGEPRGLSMAHFTLGYGLVFRRQFAEAQAELHEALRIALHVGDVEYEVVNRALLGIVQRMAGDIEAVEGGVAQTIESARTASMFSYAAMGQANRAWAELRRGRPDEARTAAEEAAEIWTRETWRVVWLAHWPLLSLALDAQDAAAARLHAKAMLAPLQYDMGPEVTTALRDGCEWAIAGEEELALTAFARAVEPARALGFL